MAKAAGTGVPRRWEWGWAAALAFGLALVLSAGEAAAQTNLCEGDVVTGRTSIITCNRAVGSMTDVHIDVRTPDITTTSFNTSPITTDDRGAGSITIDVTGGSLTAEGAWSKGIRSWLLGPSSATPACGQGPILPAYDRHSEAGRPPVVEGNLRGHAFLKASPSATGSIWLQDSC